MFDPNKLLGRILLLNKEDGKRLMDRVVKPLDDFEDKLGQDFSRLKLFFSMSDDAIEEIFTHIELLHRTNKSEE